MSRLATFQFGSPVTDVDSTFYSNTGGNLSSTLYMVASDSTGRFFANNMFFGTAQVFDQNGNKDTTWSSNASAAGYSGMGGAGTLALSGNAYVFNSSNLMKLNPNGTATVGWTPPNFTSISTPGQTFEQANGQVLYCAGSNASVGTANGTNYPGLIRFNTDGTVDTTFVANLGTGPNNNCRQVWQQSNGQLVVCGDFTSWNGNTRYGVVRLNTDGTEDGVFASNMGTLTPRPGNPNQQIISSIIQPDDKVVFSGYFYQLNGSLVGGIFRLNANGTPDTTFNSNVAVAAYSLGQTYPAGGMGIQSTGKIVIWGAWPAWNDTAPCRITRLNTDGTQDYTFGAALGTSIDSNNYANFYPNTGVIIQPDDKVVICGQFTAINQTSRNGICRIGVDGGTYSQLVVPAGVTKMMGFPCNSSGVAIGPMKTFNVTPGQTLFKINVTGPSSNPGYLGDGFMTTLVTNTGEVVMNYGGGNSATATFKVMWSE